jgi:ATP-binding cassette subfamily B protein/subfamily B ATP-binding cassette protein MsbA
MVKSFSRRTKNSIKAVFRHSIGSFSKDAQDGVQQAARLLAKRRWQMASLVVTALFAALLEGVTMGLLGLAVSVLVGEVDIASDLLGDRLGYPITQFVESTSASGLFLLLVGIAVVAQFLKSGFLYLSQAVEIFMSIGMKRDIQQKSVGQLMAMDYGQVTQYSAGQVANLIDQSDVVSEGVNGVANILRATLMLAAYATILFAMSLKMTLATVLIALLLWKSLSRVTTVLRRLGEQSMDAQMKRWRWTVEFLNAPRLLRIFNSTDSARQKINTARDEEIFPERKAKVIQAAIKPAMEAITVLGAGLFLIVGYAMAGNGAQSVIPQLFVYVLVFYRLKPQISAFTDFRIKIAWITRRLELVGAFLRKTDKHFTRKGGETFKGLSDRISIENITFQYPKSQSTALSEIEFDIPLGQTIALVGPSGAGKSTICDLLLGLYEPTQGRICVDGRDLASLDPADWRHNIGMVDQNVFLLNTSITENIRFGRADASQDDVVHAANLAYADEFIRSLESGYDTQIGEHGFKLSGGQRQRLALARALVRDPKILLLDEATSALDTISERHIQEAIKAMHGLRTIVIVAHRLSTVTNADQIVVIDKGRMVEKGTKDALIRDAGQFARMWNLQANGAQ